MRRAQGERADERHGERGERQAVVRDDPADAPALGGERGDEEDDGKHDVLDARERRKAREPEHRDLQPFARAVDSGDDRGDRAERERVADASAVT